MLFVTPALLGFALPCAVATAILLLAGRRSPAPEGRLRWAVAPALGVAYAAGHAGVALPSWPPIDVGDRIPFLALTAMVVGLFLAAWPSPGWARWENRLALVGLTLWAILGPVLAESPPMRDAFVWMAALAFLASWANLEALAARLEGPRLALPLLAVAGCASALLLVSGSLVLARFGGALTAALAAVCLIACWQPRLSLSPGGTPVVMVVLTALLLVGWCYASVSTVSLALLAVAPGAIWLEQLGAVKRLGPWKSALVGTAAALVPAGAAVAWALATAPQSDY